MPSDPQSIEFELNEETDEFHLILEGEDLGPVDMDDLRDASSSLYLHFHMFRDAPEYDFEPPEDAEQTEESLSDEEVDELLEEIELSEEEHEDAESDLQELRDE